MKTRFTKILLSLLIIGLVFTGTILAQGRWNPPAGTAGAYNSTSYVNIEASKWLKIEKAITNYVKAVKEFYDAQAKLGLITTYQADYVKQYIDDLFNEIKSTRRINIFFGFRSHAGIPAIGPKGRGMGTRGYGMYSSNNLFTMYQQNWNSLYPYVEKIINARKEIISSLYTNGIITKLQYDNSMYSIDLMTQYFKNNKLISPFFGVRWLEMLYYGPGRGMRARRY